MKNIFLRKLPIFGLSAAVLLSPLLNPSDAEASTYFGFGVSSLKVDQPYPLPTYESKNSVGLRFYIEHELDNHWSAELGVDGDFDILSERKGVDLFGLYAKYRFSTGASSFYVKGGPNHSTYYIRRNSPTIKDSGMGVLGAVGWQHQWESNWAVSAEAWYTKQSSNHAVGATLNISYGVNWFN